jgi:hypothetical protein
MNRLVTILLLAAANAFAGNVSTVTSNEVGHLFSYLRDSGCSFNRNGSWYTGGEAVDHLRKKYEYLESKGMITSAEDFITRAASESSTSGKPYLVRCGNSDAVPSGTWLSRELARYRKAGR